MMGDKWQDFAIAEIDKSGKRLPEWDRLFLDSIRTRIKSGLLITLLQEKKLMSIYQRATDPKRLPR